MNGVEEEGQNDRSGDGADHAIEVSTGFSNQGRAVALLGFHLAETLATQCRGVGLTDVVESRSPDEFLQAINWPALKQARPEDAVFEVIANSAAKA
jgi:hypothetical protein